MIGRLFAMPSTIHDCCATTTEQRYEGERESVPALYACVPVALLSVLVFLALSVRFCLGLSGRPPCPPWVPAGLCRRCLCPSWSRFVVFVCCVSSSVVPAVRSVARGRLVSSCPGVGPSPSVSGPRLGPLFRLMGPLAGRMPPPGGSASRPAMAFWGLAHGGAVHAYRARGDFLSSV